MHFLNIPLILYIFTASDGAIILDDFPLMKVTLI